MSSFTYTCNLVHFIEILHVVLQASRCYDIGLQAHCCAGSDQVDASVDGERLNSCL